MDWDIWCFQPPEHSRFSHALGALELGQRVLNNLREKDTTISNQEYEGTLIALLLHDVGHGPLSHTLEHSLLSEFNHEMMSLAIMHELNNQFDGALSTAIDIFTDQHPKKFLHQLVSSQLDLDRLDYLKEIAFLQGFQKALWEFSAFSKQCVFTKAILLLSVKESMPSRTTLFLDA